MYSLLFCKVRTKINQIGIEKKTKEERNKINLSLKETSTTFGGIYIGNDLAEEGNR
jgi:hypothetical protein